MALGTVKITMNSFLATKAHPIYLVVSPPGDRSNLQLIPIHRDGSMNRTFLIPIDEAAARNGRLKFMLKKAKGPFSCFDKVVGEVDVPVSDLLGMGRAGHEMPMVLTCNVRSTSGKIEGLLEFSYKFRSTVAASPPAMNMDETVMSYRPAPAPPAMYQPAVNAGETLMGYPPAPAPPMPCAAPPHTQMDLANPLLSYGYPPPPYAHPPAGHGYPAPPPPAINAYKTLTGYPPAPAPYTQTDLANPQLAYGYSLPAYMHPRAGHGYPAPPPPAYVHPPARYGHAAPPPHPGENLMRSVFSRVTADTISSCLNDPGSNDWFSCFSSAGFDM